jgi:hypothetical protein
MSEKHCWTMVHCDLHARCQLPVNPESNGLIQPSHVGEHCHHFQPRVVESDPWHGLASKMGAVE